ncbi:hypothetical protein [Nocardioides sp. SYSU DS0663]
MTVTVETCRHEWQPFYDAPELNGCVHCGAEQPVGPTRVGAVAGEVHVA